LLPGHDGGGTVTERRYLRGASRRRAEPRVLRRERPRDRGRQRPRGAGESPAADRGVAEVPREERVGAPREVVGEWGDEGQERFFFQSAIAVATCSLKKFS
jgi:hypothetical protein